MRDLPITCPSANTTVTFLIKEVFFINFVLFQSWYFFKTFVQNY